MNLKSIKGKAFLYLTGTFLAGLLAGGFGGYHFAKSRPFPNFSRQGMAQGMEHALRTELNLNEDQLLKSRPILEETAAKIHAMMETNGLKVDEFFAENNQKLSQILTPEQNEKLKIMEQKRKQFFKKK